MSDFLDADIDELLNGEMEDEQAAEDKAYNALLQQDKRIMSVFTDKREGLRWPDPVRKRHIR